MPTFKSEYNSRFIERTRSCDTDYIFKKKTSSTDWSVCKAVQLSMHGRQQSLIFNGKLLKINSFSMLIWTASVMKY